MTFDTAVGLLVMMWPILCKIRFETLHHSFRARTLWVQVAFSIFVNWIVAPLLMVSFFYTQFHHVINLTHKARPFMGLSPGQRRPAPRSHSCWCSKMHCNGIDLDRSGRRRWRVLRNIGCHQLNPPDGPLRPSGSAVYRRHQPGQGRY